MRLVNSGSFIALLPFAERYGITIKALKIILKTLFFISFIPYAYLLFNAVYVLIFGYDSGFFGDVSYGLKAVSESSVVILFIFSIIPVYPACLIYQIVYCSFIRRKIKKTDGGSVKE